MRAKMKKNFYGRRIAKAEFKWTETI